MFPERPSVGFNLSYFSAFSARQTAVTTWGLGPPVLPASVPRWHAVRCRDFSYGGAVSVRDLELVPSGLVFSR